MPAIVEFPLSQPSENVYELTGRFIASVIQIERALDGAILFHVTRRSNNGVFNSPKEMIETRQIRQLLGRLNLDAKCDLLREFIIAEGSERDAELPAMVSRVIKHRHRFAHKLVSLRPDGGVNFFNELTHEIETFTSDQQRALEREALKAQHGCASLANRTV